MFTSHALSRLCSAVLLLFAAPAAELHAQVRAEPTLPPDLVSAIEAELAQLVRDDARTDVRIARFEAMPPSPDGSLPTVSVSLVDPALTELPPGVVRRPAALFRDLGLLMATFAEVLPDEREEGATVAVVAHAAADPTVLQRVAREADTRRVALVPARSAEAVLAEVEALEPALVYVDAETGLDDVALGRLADGLAVRRVPAFAAAPSLVERGFLASASPAYEESLARRVALAVVDAQAGNAPATAPPALPEVQYTIHTATVERLGLALPWDLLLRADLVGEPAHAASGLTLDQATRIAARDNAGVAVEAYGLDAAEAAVGIARSTLLPQATGSTTARLINEDLAAAALGGASPERLWTAEASVVQVLFSERAFAGVSVQRRLALAQAYRLEEARLAAAAEGAHAFIDVLEAETATAIAEERLGRLSVDLGAAQARQRAGTASAADVARLQAEAARARQDLARALGGVDASTFALNQTLSLPIDAAVRPVIEGGTAQRGAEATMLASAAPIAEGSAASSALADPRALLASIPVLPAVGSPAEAQVLADYYVEQALMDAPAARALGAVIEAQERRLGAARRAPYLPEVSVFANASTRLAEGGAGLTLPPGLPIPAAPDETWAVGVRLDFGLFLGGRQQAERRLARAELGQAQARLDLVEQRLTQGVRTAAALLGASHAAYSEAEEAAAAAAEAYADVARLYREGIAGVTELVEAQEALRLTEELAAASAYEVAGAYVDLQRAVGSFDALDEPLLPTADAPAASLR
ncbi:MAG: TolC family protein [Bacteroidota bacterium]